MIAYYPKINMQKIHKNVDNHICYRFFYDKKLILNNKGMKNT